MSPTRIRFALAASSALLGLIALGGCSSTAPNASTSSVSPGTTSPTGTPSGQPSTTSDGITLSDADDQRDVTVHVGQHVRVVLNSTYWTITDSDHVVLAPTSTASASPSGSCVPGEGCGTVTQDFVARAAGTSVVSASRTSCGEAMRCTGRAGLYRVTVNVVS